MTLAEYRVLHTEILPALWAFLSLLLAVVPYNVQKFNCEDVGRLLVRVLGLGFHTPIEPVNSEALKTVVGGLSAAAEGVLGLRVFGGS